MDSRSAFISFLLQPSNLAELQPGQPVFEREEVRSFSSSMQLMHSAAEKNATLNELVPLISRVDGFHAGMLALLCGVLVEDGGDATIPIHTTLELMISQLTRMQDYVKFHSDLSLEEMFLHFPEATRAHAALPFTLPAVMTMLSRDKETRKQWYRRQDVIELIEGLEDTEEIPYYLERIFTLVDDKDLLVLDPLNKRGFLMHLVGVQDMMYHCYALLQHAILEHTGPGYLDAEPTDPEAVRYAQNYLLTPQDHLDAQKLIDHQRFNFSYPGALFFPGSASFSEVPTSDGVPFLLIEKKNVTFQWQPNNMYPALHEALNARIDMVRELTREEVDIWLRRIFN